MIASCALVVFPDTNVLIQGRALREQPWVELGRDPIDVVLCGPLIRELDRLKTKPGRAGKVARALSAKVRELMSAADGLEILRDAGPRVSLRLGAIGPAATAVRDGLDLSNDDQALINQALAAGDGGDDVVLLTDDNFAAMNARHFGLAVRMLPPHWLKEPEADDGARELARRDAEIARLKAVEPIIRLRFDDGAGTEILRLDAAMERFVPVPSTDVDRLLGKVTAFAPMHNVKPASAAMVARPVSEARSFDLAEMSFSSLGRAPVTDADVAKYGVDYRSWLEGIGARLTQLHEKLNRRRDWPTVSFAGGNVGTRPAEDVLVEIEASGDFKLESVRRIAAAAVRAGGDSLALPLPPVRPRSRSIAEMMSGVGSFAHDTAPFLSRAFPTMPAARNEDDFYWREGRSGPTDKMSLDCKRWRHGRDEEVFPFRVSADDGKSVKGAIVARISASNKSEPQEKRLPLRISFEDRGCVSIAEQLVDELRIRLGGRD